MASVYNDTSPGRSRYRLGFRYLETEPIVPKKRALYIDNITRKKARSNSELQTMMKEPIDNLSSLSDLTG